MTGHHDSVCDLAKWSLWIHNLEMFGLVSFLVEPPGEQDIIVTITVQCMCISSFMHPSVCLSELVGAITTTTDGFQNNLTQLFSIMYRCAT